jgi:4'-phosphopantetheinyl transferase
MQAFFEISFTDLPCPFALTKPDIHVWQSKLDLPIEQIEKLAQLLSVDEHDRANRFRFKTLRHRFVACRGILRLILAGYLKIDPAEIRFAYSPTGKPSLAADLPLIDGVTLSFNVTHSEELALYAVTLDRQVGIDLEYLPPSRDVHSLAKRFFAPREYAHLCTVPPSQQQAAFLQLWTFKEAYLKATGEGLMGLKRVEVSLPLNESSHEISNEINLDAISAALTIDSEPDSVQWQALKLLPNPDYVAALVAEGTDWHLVYYHLSYPQSSP